MKLPRASKPAARTRLALMLAAGGLCGAAAGAGTDISSVPLFTATNVKPNFMFLMDDSASMLRWWLPDQASPWAPSQNTKTDRDPLSPAPNAYYEESKTSKVFKYGQYTTQCNYLAYNPATTYLPPLDEQGAAQPPARMSDFDDEKYQPFYFVYNAAGKAPAMGFKWVNGEVETNTFYYECNSLIGQGSGAPVFDRVEVRKLSKWEQQNFQNWRYYYSTRREMAKAAIKQVFRRVKDDYRVGYSRTSYDKAVDLSSTTKADRWKFLDIRDFDDGQKLKFFGAIHNSDGGFNTPIRGALSKAGQYFANKAPLQALDPIQHSCQRNFTLLATDGGWTKAGERLKGGDYYDFGPYGISKTMATPVSVGQQDKGPTVDRPMRDAGGDGTETLSDVAAYYYNIDLRDKVLFDNCTGGLGTDVCKNNVKGETADAFHSFGDSSDKQHMTTMTLGLGLNGSIAYRPDYRTATKGDAPRDFYDIVKGDKNWPALADPGDKNDYLPLTHNDDLWHAAVNGRGQYFSASDPTSLIRSLSEALDIVKASTGAASAASTSTIRPTGDNNDAFVASYVSQKWIGDVQRFRVNPKTGALENQTWSARTELDKLASADRNIFYKKPDANANRAFTADNLRDDGLGSHFRNFCAKTGASGSGKPDQCEMLQPTEFAEANKVDNLVKFIRGDKSLGYFRKRESTLGDITNASLLYAGSPSFPYQDPTYVNYKKNPTSVNRPKIVLAAANDGMLHAFDRETGTEKWAFIPTAVMPNLYKLADTNYPNNHAAFVDATPVLADVYIDKGKGEGKKWYTIVVGGLGSGGRGYYALDITNPLAPEVLWEYDSKSHPDLGLSFGNPIITKRQGKDGKWVVVFASGMNNPSGVGKLFVLDAATGKLDISEPLSTGVGTPDEPSGLTYINAWVAAEGDNQALRFYGGDLLGNLWRFDLDGLLEPKGEALLLAKLVGPGDKGKPQPVTTKPALAEVKHNGLKYAMVYVATGRYLGISDLSDKSVQSFYAIKDPLTAKGWSKVRGSFDFVENTVVAGTATNGDPTRQVNSSPVDLSSKGGWYADFPVAGERVSVAPALALGAVYVPVNSPAPYTCQVGGSSFLYRFDILTGSGSASFRGDVLIQGLSVIQLTDGPNKGATAPVSTGSDGGVRVDNENPPTFGVGLKRASWRELVK
jgi:type IV pilus assembly protein PilY1